MTEHSILSPSSFPRLVPCPGSRDLESRFPREESEAAAEGILAHSYASNVLKYKCDAFNFDRKSFGDNEEMDRNIQVYTNHVLKILIDGIQSNFNLDHDIHIEERIEIPYLHAECFGTPDCWYYDEEKNEIHVWDFKYGFKPVEVRENWQLIGYASGISTKVSCSFNDEEVLEKIGSMIFNLHIVQPRARHRDGSIRTWTMTRGAFVQYESTLANAIEMSFYSENPTYSIGEHCTYCKAKSICPQLKKESNVIIKKELKIEKPKNDQLNSTIKRKFNIPINLINSQKNKIDCLYLEGITIKNDSEAKCKIYEILYDVFQKEINTNNIALMPDGSFELGYKLDDKEYECKHQEQDSTLEQSIINARKSINILKLRLEALEKQALEKIQSGKEVPGFSAKKVWGRLGWNISAKDVQMLGNELKLNLTKPSRLEVITPLQAIKLAKNDDAIRIRIKDLSSCKFSGFKLVSEDEAGDDDEVNFDEL